MIEVTDLSKSFKDKKRGTIRAVDHVSFRCPRGEVFGLLGLNGAGKTTTLRVLATMLKPDSGTATVNGFDLLQDPEQTRRRSASIGQRADGIRDLAGIEPVLDLTVTGEPTPQLGGHVRQRILADQRRTNTGEARRGADES